MVSKWIWTLRSILRKLWLRVVAFAALAIAAAVLAPLLAPFLPESRTDALGDDALDEMLAILSSSMLAVTTFSLSIAVNAFTAAASTATPRSIALLQEDKTTQNVLATFLGAFVFALVAIIGLNAGLYDPAERVVLFMVTVLVLALVVVTLFRWMGYLPEFGRMTNTLDRVEEAARHALVSRLEMPWMGGHRFDETPPEGTSALTAQATGYVQHMDMGALEEIACKNDLQLYLEVLPGAFVYPGAALLHHDGSLSEQVERAMRGAVTIGKARSFDQDPGYGMVVLAEIGSRALSPGVNDAGTAIAVIGRQLSVLTEWQNRAEPDIDFDHIHVPSTDPRALVAEAFRPILRDGAGQGQVMLHLLGALDGLRCAAPDVFGRAVADILDEMDDRLGTCEGLSQRDRAELDARRQAMDA